MKNGISKIFAASIVKRLNEIVMEHCALIEYGP